MAVNVFLLSRLLGVLARGISGNQESGVGGVWFMAFSVDFGHRKWLVCFLFSSSTSILAGLENKVLHARFVSLHSQ